MSFGGTFGAAAAMTPIGIMSSTAGTLTYNADAISVDLQKNGVSASSFAIEQINNLRILGSGSPLGVFVALGDGSTGDRGTLVTGAPGANEHGIPANFGPGRGNWTSTELARLRVLISFYQTGSLANASIGQATAQPPTLAGGDISVIIRNISLAACASLTIDLEYRHSIGLS